MKKIALNTILFGVATIAATLSLVACGDSNTTQINQTGLDMVSSVEDLPKCTSSNEGEQIIVKDDGTIRYCSDGKWYATMGSAGAGTADTIFVSKNDTVFVGGDFACTTEKLKDDSGIKIICNGDSIGVVLNGADGKDGVDGAKGDTGEKGDAGSDGKDGKPGENGRDGADCTVANENGALTITCGEKSVVMKLGEDGSLIGGEEIILDSEKVAISLDSVKGASQKGPFLSGSKVLVKELEDGRSLTQTGNNFDGKILNDKGEFKITARMLVSQYVMLEATGYYRNEVTGQNSSSPLTLFGITDVTTRNIVNINLLTHLEYERVIYLVTKKKMTVHEAKKKAQQEIFDILHIDNTNFSNSEDLSIAGSSDEDGALLAFSILFQGDRSVSQLTELLTRVSTAMEKEGKWEDATTKSAMAKWAADADSAGRYAKFRENVSKWNLSAMVPNFEKYVRHFWYEEYGLDECSGANAGTVVAPAKGPIVGSKTRYICVDGLWKIASDEEKDTYQWKAGTDGELKYGNVNTEVYYVYDADGVLTENGNAGWRKADDVEKQHGGCRAEMFGEIRKDVYHSAYYRCDAEAHKWLLETRYVIIDTQKWPKGSDGDVKWGDTVTTNCYVYDDANKGWRSGNTSDCTLKLMGCTVKRLGERRQSPVDDEYYSCSGEQMWTHVTDDVLLNTDGYKCVEGAFVFGKLAKTSHFVCDNGEWRAATTGEETVGAACIASTDTVFNTDSLWTCIASNWRHSTVYDFRVGARNYFNPDKEYGELIDKRDGRHYKTIKIGDHVWMAENLNYADSSVNGSYYLRGNNWCYNNDSLNCLKGGRYYTWTAAMDIDSKWQNASATDVGLIADVHQGICPDGWHIPSEQEWNDLYDAVGVSPYALQARGNAEWPNANNTSGFTGLSVGRYDLGNFDYVGFEVLFWSTLEREDDTYAHGWYMHVCSAAYIDSGDKFSGHSIRCLQDQN